MDSPILRKKANLKPAAELGVMRQYHERYNELKIALFVFLLFSFNLNSEANDSVVEISSSGLIFSEEKNISMTKEISVQYEFENESKNEVAVTIGFPIPPFGIEWPSNTQSYPLDFGNFKVMVNGVEVKAVTENGEGITNFLKEKIINYQTFGGFDIQPQRMVLLIQQLNCQTMK